MRFAGIFCLAWLFYSFDFSNVAEMWLELESSMLLKIALLSASLVVIKFFRWHCLLRMNNFRPPAGPSMVVYCQGMFWGLISPGRLGEFSKCYFLKQKFGFSYDKTAALVIFDRIYDLAFLVPPDVMAHFVICLERKSIPKRISFALQKMVPILLGFCDKYRHPVFKSESPSPFLEKLRQKNRKIFRSGRLPMPFLCFTKAKRRRFGERLSFRIRKPPVSAPLFAPTGDNGKAGAECRRQRCPRFRMPPDFAAASRTPDQTG